MNIKEITKIIKNVDNDVIMLGELINRKEQEAAIKNAETGVFIYCTINGESDYELPKNVYSMNKLYIK